jgi:hypothetical protein
MGSGCWTDNSEASKPKVITWVFLTKTPKSQFDGGGRADEGKIAPESV